MSSTAPSARPSDAASKPAPSPHALAQERRRALILDGPIGRGVFMIAYPSVGTMLLLTLNSMLDRFFIGRLGPEALAAQTVCQTLSFAILAVVVAVSVGTQALISRFVGANELDDARTAARQSLIAAALLSLAVCIPMLLLRDPILVALGLDAEARPLASAYLFYFLFSIPSLFVMQILASVFRSVGDTVRPLWVTIVAITGHMIFNYLLIFGKFGFPKMGLAGGGLATNLSQAIAVVLYIEFVRHTPLAGLFRGSWKISVEWTKRILKIGLPAAGQQLVRSGSMLAFQTLIAHRVGSAALAALGVGIAAEALAFMPGFAYQSAAGAFVGQNLGAQKPERARAAGWAAAWQACAIMSLMGVAFFFFAEPFAHLFIQRGEHGDAAVTAESIRLTVLYLKIASISEPFFALGMVLTGALQGAGETRSPTWITMISMLGVRLPLAVLLLSLFGVAGGWWALSATQILSGLLTVAAFRSGRWQKVKV